MNIVSSVNFLPWWRSAVLSTTLVWFLRAIQMDRKMKNNWISYQLDAQLLLYIVNWIFWSCARRILLWIAHICIRDRSSSIRLLENRMLEMRTINAWPITSIRWRCRESHGIHTNGVISHILWKISRTCQHDWSFEHAEILRSFLSLESTCETIPISYENSTAIIFPVS